MMTREITNNAILALALLASLIAVVLSETIPYYEAKQPSLVGNWTGNWSSTPHNTTGDTVSPTPQEIDYGMTVVIAVSIAGAILFWAS